jgi:hypothetical protein
VTAAEALANEIRQAQLQVLEVQLHPGDLYDVMAELTHGVEVSDDEHPTKIYGIVVHYS